MIQVFILDEPRRISKRVFALCMKTYRHVNPRSDYPASPTETDKTTSQHACCAHYGRLEMSWLKSLTFSRPLLGIA